MEDGNRARVLDLLRERIIGFAAFRVARDAAEDLAQEVLMLLHEKYPHVHAVEELVPLALKIVRFKLAALHRKHIRHGDYTAVPVDDLPVAASDPPPDELYARRERAERLRAALAGLGERCKEIFRMKLSGMSFEEIREALGVAAINTVYTWDFRCRKQLLARLGGSYDQPGARSASGSGRWN